MSLTHLKRENIHPTTTARPGDKGPRRTPAAAGPTTTERQVQGMLRAAVALTRRAGRAETTLSWVAGAHNAPLSAKADALQNLAATSLAKRDADRLVADIQQAQGSPETWRPRLTAIATRVKMSEAMAGNLERIVTGARVQNAKEATDHIGTAQTVGTIAEAGVHLGLAAMTGGTSAVVEGGLSLAGQAAVSASAGAVLEGAKAHADERSVLPAAAGGAAKGLLSTVSGGSMQSPYFQDGASLLYSLSDTALGGMQKKKR